LGAAQAAAISLVAVATPVVLAWVTGGVTSGDWSSALRIGLVAWLLAHHTGFAVEGGYLGIVPLGLTAVPLVSCWFAARRVALVLDPVVEDVSRPSRARRPAAEQRAGSRPGRRFGTRPGWRARAARRSGQETRARAAVPGPVPVRGLVAFVGTYTMIVVCLTPAVGFPSVVPVTSQAMLGGAVLATLAGAAGIAAHRHRGAVAGLRACWRGLRPPSFARGWAAPATVAVGVLLGGAAILLAVGLVTGHERIGRVHEALDPGVAGGLVLTVVQFALLPNAVVWAAAYAAGPGFVLGTGTSVTYTSSTVGALPALPLLGALPSPGAMPPWTAAVLAVPVLAGVAAGTHVVLRGRSRGRWWRVRDALGAAVLTGCCLFLLAWLSGGAAGPGRLGQVGPHPGAVAVVVAGEVAVGALAAVAVGSVLRRARSLLGR